MQQWFGALARGRALPDAAATSAVCKVLSSLSHGTQALSNQEEARAAGGQSPRGSASPPAQLVGLPGSRQVLPKPQQQLTGSRDYRDLGAMPAAVSTTVLHLTALMPGRMLRSRPAPLLHSGLRVCR